MSNLIMGYWDCPYCGTKENPGTAVNCPSCGRARGDVQFYVKGYQEEQTVTEAELQQIGRLATQYDTVVMEDLAYFAMDFRAQGQTICEQILFEHCYGYPLGGQFIAIDYCYDIPRILHCHVNPAVMREFRGDYPKEVNDAVIARRTYAYSIDHTDNAQVMDIFTFATYGGIMLGAATYGQMTNFNFDCVCNGIFKDGDSDFNRVWEVAQGSIIANCSPSGNLSEIHPLLMQGKGHLSLTNVDAFSGDNGVVTNLAQSYDFMTVRGSNVVCVTGVNCRMRNYSADEPVTVSDYSARISFLNCTDKNNNIFNWTYGI